MNKKYYCIDCNSEKSEVGVRCRECENIRRKIEIPHGIYNSQWKGESACYMAKHTWIHRNWGKASKCEMENCIGKSVKYEWANISGKYYRKISDWKQMCKTCHILYDRKNKCYKGHELDERNSYITPSNGSRRCRICMVKYYQDNKREFHQYYINNKHKHK